MPSENTKHNQPIFQWKKAEAAPEEEQNIFWKELRNFYRTGIKPEIPTNKILTSVFDVLLASQLSFENGTEDQIESKELTQLLNEHISGRQEATISRFRNKLQELINGLGKVLSIEDDSIEHEQVYDFATEIIAFDKLSELLPKYDNNKLTEKRRERLQAVLDDLREGLKNYQSQEAHLIVSYNNEMEYANLERVKIIPIKAERAIQQAENILKARMDSFSRLIRSFRIASLEVDEQYEDEIHDEFFDHFSWYRLTADEKRLFQPVILVLDKDQLNGRLDALSKLLSCNWPIKLLVLNRQVVTKPIEDVRWEDASHRVRRELSTFCITHRNVFTFQSTLGSKETLSEGIEEFLNVDSPAVAHLLIPSTRDLEEFKFSKAATYGRYFPSIAYHPNSTIKMNIQSNPFADESWSQHEVQLDGQESPLNLSFTYADYKAFFNEKVDELYIVPSAYDNNYLVPLADYLEMSNEELYGKIPYIWLVDEDKHLYKAAIPNVWVVSCQERLDFWNFLQSMQELRKEISPSSNEIESLKEAHKVELEKVKEEATSIAAERLIKELLSEE